MKPEAGDTGKMSPRISVMNSELQSIFGYASRRARLTVTVKPARINFEMIPARSGKILSFGPIMPDWARFGPV
jgi:hypothetical protein